MHVVPIILAGGTGTRLWPLSRSEFPKQFHSLEGTNTLLQDTLKRFEGIDGLADPVVICNTEHRFIVADQLKEIGFPEATLILEPFGKNTAAAIAAASVHVKKTYSEKSIMVILSSDHHISNLEEFKKSLSAGVEASKNYGLILLGSSPSNSDNRYGFIKVGDEIESNKFFDVASFKEKPSKKESQIYSNNESYLWNCGMFIFVTKKIIDQMEAHSPDTFTFTQASYKKAKIDGNFIKLSEEYFKKITPSPIDKAVIEKSDQFKVLKLDAGWSDIGTWDSLHDNLQKDSEKNYIAGDVISSNTTNSLVISKSRLIVTQGLSDLIIVDTPDALLVINKNETDKIKDLVDLLVKNRRNEVFKNKKVYRPWGWFDSISNSSFSQVKVLHVASKQKLSLQKHKYRSEHWVVRSGRAKVILGDDIFYLDKGESIYIPAESKHSLENELDEPLEIIEVQTGDYLGEDDIVRFDDLYGRLDDS